MRHGKSLPNIGRDRSAIYHEIRRNTLLDQQISDLDGAAAHNLARGRRTNLWKLASFSHVHQFMIDRIIYGWSPQQITGRMRLERQPVSVFYSQPGDQHPARPNIVATRKQFDRSSFERSSAMSKQHR